MGYTIKNTGGVLNIGQLMDFDGETVDIATNKAAIQATWKDSLGDSYANIGIAESDGDDYACQLDIQPNVLRVTGTLSPDVTGDYYRYGTYGGKTLWKLNGASYYDYWDTVNDIWVIATSAGGTSLWSLSDPAPDGVYTKDSGISGELTAATIIDNATLPLGSQTIRLSSTTDAIISRNIVIEVLAEVAYNNLYSGTDTQALIAAVAVVDGNVDDVETKVNTIDTKTSSIITGINTLGSRSLNDLYGSNNVLIP